MPLLLQEVLAIALCDCKSLALAIAMAWCNQSRILQETTHRVTERMLGQFQPKLWGRFAFPGAADTL